MKISTDFNLDTLILNTLINNVPGYQPRPIARILRQKILKQIYVFGHIVTSEIDWLIDIKDKGLSRTLITPYEFLAEYAKKICPDVIIIIGNILEMDIKKYNTVLMNPPYTDGIWMKFFVEMLEHTDTNIVCINPDTSERLTSTGEKYRKLLNDNGIQVKEDCTEHFPTVTTGNISYFICNKTKDPADVFGLNVVQNKLVPDTDDKSIFTRALLKVKELTIHDTKVINTLPIVCNVNKNGVTIKYTKTSKDSFRKKHKNDIKGKVFVLNRHFGKNENDPVYEISCAEDYYFSDNVIVYKPDDNETLNNFKSVYTSAVYRYVINLLGGGQAIRDAQLRQIVKLDLSRTWTEDEINQHFKLTVKEIEDIDNSFKK